MACAHAKFSGDVGVCLATSGPGAIHLLNGLYDAKLDHQPVVAIVGQQSRMSLGASYQQEVDLVSLFKDVASEFVQVATVAGQVTHLIDRAVQIARGTRSVTCVIVPSDLQEEPAEPAPRAHGSVFSGGPMPKPRVLPHDADLARAAEVLNAGERVAILIGQGARGAAAEVEQLALRLGAGVAKALNGRDVLPDDLPYVTGSIGLLGTKPSDAMMQGCDTLLMIGSGFPYSEWLPEPGQARGVQIDIDAKMLGIRYPMEVNLAGDARDTLLALLPLLEEKADRAWADELEGEIERWWRLLGEQAEVAADPLSPLKVFHELSPRLPDGCMLTADSGSGTNWWARHLRFRRGMRGALSGTLATMGPALPYALAAKFVHPDRPVIAIEGDGAMQMNGISALIDVAKYRDRWSDPRFILLVLNNQDLNQVTWEQRVMAGDPKLDASQVIPDFPYARYAELLGFEGIRVSAPDEVGPAWERALAADRPVVYEAIVDPEVPPLPPHIEFEQAKNLARALAQGDPARGRIIRQSLKQKAQELLER
jgi:pyruvate dehydrogenase (quinone)